MRYPIPPKGWRKNTEDNLSKQKEKAEAQAKTVVTEKTVEVDTPPPEPEATDGKVSAEAKKRLPRVIVATYDKEGKLVHREYVCSKLDINEDTRTVLAGAMPTKRQDYIHISIDADVVQVN